MAQLQEQIKNMPEDQSKPIIKMLQDPHKIQS